MKTAPRFAFTEREVKLLRLFLDPVASFGEVQNGAVKLAESLRARSIEAEALQVELAMAPAAKYAAPDYGKRKMPFGQFKGQSFTQVSRDYLEFIYNWIRTNPQAPAFHHRLCREH